MYFFKNVVLFKALNIWIYIWKLDSFIEMYNIKVLNRLEGTDSFYCCSSYRNPIVTKGFLGKNKISAFSHVQITSETLW